MAFQSDVSDMPAKGTAQPAAMPAGFELVHVQHVEAAGPDAIFVSVIPPAAFTHRPAQVVELAVDGRDINYFAIASGPGEPLVSFLIKRSVPFAAIDAVRPGDRIWLRGPWGKGFDTETVAPLVLCGIGSAYGALRSALVGALASRQDGHQMTLLLGLRRFAALPNPAEVGGWIKRGVRVVLALSAPDDTDRASVEALGAFTAVGRITECLKHHIHDGDAVLLAASEDAENEVIAMLGAAGIASTSIQRNFRPDYRDAAG